MTLSDSLGPRYVIDHVTMGFAIYGLLAVKHFVTISLCRIITEILRVIC